jgi:hypothetical protein
VIAIITASAPKAFVERVVHLTNAATPYGYGREASVWSIADCQKIAVIERAAALVVAIVRL